MKAQVEKDEGPSGEGRKAQVEKDERPKWRRTKGPSGEGQRPRGIGTTKNINFLLKVQINLKVYIKYVLFFIFNYFRCNFSPNCFKGLCLFLSLFRYTICISFRFQ